MEIFRLSIRGQEIVFPKGNKNSANKIDLLTGPNGSGKTRALSALAHEFGEQESFSRRGEYIPNDLKLELIDGSPPRKVIAQTYSPFSRFPSPTRNSTRGSLTSLYSEGKRQKKYYTCLGLYRTRQAIIDNLSKQALEESIFNLSEAPECAQLIARVMHNIGFEDRFVLHYTTTPQLNEILNAYNTRGVEGILDELYEAQFRPGFRTHALREEIGRTDPEQFAELLAESFVILDDLRTGNRNYKAEFGSYSRKSTYDYAIVQALSLLRQLDMLKLNACELTNFDSVSFDVVQASSGQQQMICSIMDLASTLEDNSLVLIDEPELSLHPQWQQMYLDHLHAALEPFRGCHILIATHSPLVVQRGLQTGAGVIQLSSEHDSVPSVSSTSVEGALLDVFDTPVSNSVYLANQIFSAITKAENGGALERRASRRELNRLAKIYKNSPTDNGKTLELINQAISLLGSEGQNGA